MGYTLGDAARATGLNKSTILKAIRSGKVNGTKDAHGQWCMEPCELHRVYPKQKELLLEARVVDLEADSNAWREQAQKLALTSVVSGPETERPVAGPAMVGIAALLLIAGLLLWATSSVKGTPSHASNSSLAVHHVQPVW
jgi:hypothetical protein